MFLKVLPLDISFGREGLTYFAKDSEKEYLNIGGVVSIPIKDRISYGIISSFEDSNGLDGVKAIVGSICSYPILSGYQIQMTFALSSKYMLPIHKVLNLFLPKAILGRFEKTAFQDVLDFEIPEIGDSGIPENRFVHNSSMKDPLDILDFPKLEKEGAVLVFGDDFSVESFMEKHPEMKVKSLIHKNSMTYAKKYRLFKDVMKKEKSILIGTRKILQYNLARYRNIIYFEDALVKYNYNQFEKYRNTDILEMMAKTNKFNINIISSVPSVEMYALSKRLGFSHITP